MDEDVSSDDEVVVAPRDASWDQIDELLEGFRVGMKDELAILQTLTEISDINGVVQNVNIRRMFRSFRDHHWRGPSNRSDMFALLGKIRVVQLSIESKVLLISAAIKGRSRNPDLIEQGFLLDIFKATHGQDLSDLKHALDHHSHDTTLASILRTYFEDEVLRKEFEAYIDAEARTLMQKEGFKPRIHVLSDIDDTFVQSGFGLGGPKYPDGTVLPGVLALFTALNAHVVFITARPASALKHSFGRLNKLCGMVGAAVLTGRLRDSVLIPFKPAVANSMICERKLANFAEHAKMFPECVFLWFGDSGQSDIEVGIQLMQRPRVLGAFIQDVSMGDGMTLKTPRVDREALDAAGVHVVNNYVDVACLLHQKGRITPLGLQSTASSACATLKVIESSFSKSVVFDVRRAELNASVARANGFLTAAGVPSVPLL